MHLFGDSILLDLPNGDEYCDARYNAYQFLVIIPLVNFVKFLIIKKFLYR